MHDRFSNPGIWDAGLAFMEVPGLEAHVFLYNKKLFIAMCVSSQYEMLT